MLGNKNAIRYDIIKCSHRVPYQVMIAGRTESFFTVDIAACWTCVFMLQFDFGVT